MESLLNEYKTKHVSSNEEEETESALSNHPMNALLDEYRRKHGGNKKC